MLVWTEPLLDEMNNVSEAGRRLRHPPQSRGAFEDEVFPEHRASAGRRKSIFVPISPRPRFQHPARVNDHHRGQEGLRSSPGAVLPPPKH